MICVDSLDFTYPMSKKPTLKSISFKIDRGEIFGFLGPSGAGKTTTQKILIGLLEGYEGKVLIMGKERNQWKNDFYENIGVAFDFPNLYQKLTAYENLSLIASYYQNTPQDMDILLDHVGLLPYKNKRVETFSKGMQMRLNFIRALLHDPDILFFDEPTTGLDPVNAKIIKNMILELKSRKKTIFLTTHNMAVAEQLCDQVAFIVDGKIPVIDNPNQLKIKYGDKKVKVIYMDKNKEASKDFNQDALAENNEFLDILKTKKVVSLHSQEATLENIFIHLTGRQIL